MPNHDNNDDYPASWSERIFHTPTTDIKNVSWWAYTEQELENITLRDVANTDHFVETIKNLNNQPFFSVLGLHKPHMPWDAPKEFFDLYPNEEDIDLPHNPYIPEDMPESAWTGFKNMLKFEDCSPEGSGIPNIGDANVTYPDSKERENINGKVKYIYCLCFFTDKRVEKSLLCSH